LKGEASESPEKKLGAKAYQGAFEAIFSVLIGAGFGWLADDRLGTAPGGMLVGLALGFGAFILRIVRLHRELMPPESPPGKASPPSGPLRGDDEREP
jgi:ATP synthase protein I